MICKIIRVLGLLGAAWLIWSICLALALSTPGGLSQPRYFITVTFPYALLAMALLLPYSKLKGGWWGGAFALLCLAGGYVCLYLLTHLPAEDWILIAGSWLLILSQPVAVWLSRQKMSTQLQ